MDLLYELDLLDEKHERDECEETARTELDAPSDGGSPWDNMSLPAIYQHLLARGEDSETAAAIVDGVMADRMANGDGDGTRQE